MIANSTELTVAARGLKIMDVALKALREQLKTTNPELLGIAEKAYVRRIEDLQADISHYLCDHPTEVLLLVQVLGDLEPATEEKVLP